MGMRLGFCICCDLRVLCMWRMLMGFDVDLMLGLFNISVGIYFGPK